MYGGRLVRVITLDDGVVSAWTLGQQTGLISTGAVITQRLIRVITVTACDQGRYHWQYLMHQTQYLHSRL